MPDNSEIIKFINLLSALCAQRTALRSPVSGLLSPVSLIREIRINRITPFYFLNN